MPSNIFLLWHRGGRSDQDPARIARKLRRLYAPVMKKRPTVITRQTAVASMVFLMHPPRGWAFPYFEENAGNWAVATDFPINAHAVLSTRADPPLGKQLLLDLGRKLRSNATELLRHLVPPFAMAWSNSESGVVHVQNDGLGLAQLFAYGDDRALVVTNRLFALQVLGIRLKPVAEEWAARWALDFFPMSLTGYRGVRFIDPSSQITLQREGATTRNHDVLPDWLTPAGNSEKQCIEDATAASYALVRDVTPHMTRITAMTSGGRDSRAVLACLRASGAHFRVLVGGLPSRPDVVVAAELARRSGFRLVHEEGGLPATSLRQSEHSIRRALLWEAGYGFRKMSKFFLAGGRFMGNGRIKVSGKHGEIARGFYAKRLGPALDDKGLEARFVEYLLARLPTATRRRLRMRARDIFLEAYRQADCFGVEGRRKLDFFYLYQRTRRCMSGSHSAKAGIVFAPLLTPAFIRAAYTIPSARLRDNPIHRHIIAEWAPEWNDVPFADDVARVSQLPAVDNYPRAIIATNGEVPAWKRPVGGRNFDNSLYWRTDGHPLVAACLEADGFWHRVFDPTIARKRPHRDADAIVITCLLEDVLSGRIEPALSPA